MLKTLSSYSKILLGILSTIFGLKGFLIPNHFIDGGVTGISMLLSFIFNQPIYLLILLVNIPFLIIGLIILGRRFFARSSATMLIFSLGLFFLTFPTITQDKVLSAIFGGFFIGAGIGLAIRGTSVLDGTEILALLISKKTNFSIGDIILGFNVVIFTSSAYFIGIEEALYSILAYGSASITIKYILKGIEEYSGVFIISKSHLEIKEESYKKLKRGFTVINGKGGYMGNELSILYCVLTRLEVPQLKEIIDQIDPSAFLVFHPVDEARGGIIGKPSFS